MMLQSAISSMDTIEEEVYVHQPPGFVDPAHPNKVYKVIKALYGLHQAPRAWYETLSSFLMENGFRRDSYILEIESNKPLVKDEDGEDVDVHVYKSMIGSLMYLTTSRPGIMFAVCACARFQVTLKASHLNAVNGFLGLLDWRWTCSQQETYSTALTKLVLRVKKLESKLKSGKARRKAKIEEEVHEKPSDETEVLVQEETPTEIIKEHGSGEKGEIEISTANIQVSTASPPKVSTAVPHVYTRRSAKDKGKAIMEEPATPKKVKKRTQVQLSMDEELARKLEEEERIRFNAEQEARALQEEEEERLNLEAARELQRQLDQRQDVPIQPTQTQGIDWNDPSVLRYHALKNKPVSIAQARRNMITYLKNQGGYKESYFKKMYNDIRPIFERVWDHVNTFIPIGSEVEKDSSKPSERETSKIVEEEKVEEEDVNPEPVLIEKKAVGIRRKTLARRRASDKQGQDSSKRQKKEKGKA
ncbi:putative ribonuclease H-like domain-containing protein [Tanacetum coccineum]|uniref:Ribonuclease H-like domain-containing protein n=1 Tax=Tanacetum coccineum TaxID=301880 RepID=A0ABQ5B840_9ASTR